jgi:hypothetical protein
MDGGAAGPPRRAAWVTGALGAFAASVVLAAACTAALRRGEQERPPVPKASEGRLVVPTLSTTPALKVAFIADTGTERAFRDVLRLIVRESAKLVLIQGDLTYGGETAEDWLSTIDSELDVPYLVAKGNHDVEWSTLGRGLEARMAKWGIASEDGGPRAPHYSVVHEGLKVVLVGDRETEPTREAYVRAQLRSDPHLFRICSWHKNMRRTNVGPKDDEMSWGLYEACRAGGAIVAQGHSHTYSRSKTLTRDEDQSVDAACADPFELCVGSGRHFFFDSSLGGKETRPLDLDESRRPHWAATYSGSYGALFVTFHDGGDPRRATGYFKTVGGVVIDPPASSGRAVFSITRVP